MNDTFEKMDRMYRFQRHFYDLTRKYYLLGRDKLLRKLMDSHRNRILEIGCGTGRNLIILGRQMPAAKLFGLDASAAMIETAINKARSNGIKNLKFARELAGSFSFRKTFGLAEPFDAIFFSYSLSMIPDWGHAIDNAFRNLAGDGTIYCVDFFDMAGLPGPFAGAMRWWLSKFGVSYCVGIKEYLMSLDSKNRGVEFRTFYGGYCFIASVGRSR
ncbi:MAG: hypothetical protein C4325_09060 [Blastocatellia bacterium]